jgi:hypothetical protein|tara:strand:- start:4220 stop:4594 length:375 start_codon:yes stop_codon:yes gene_type:complete
MSSRWRVLEAAALPLFVVLFMGLWQGLRHQTDVISDLNLQLNELEQNIEVNRNNLMEEQLEFLQRRQQTLETEMGELKRSQQRWINQEQQRLKRQQVDVMTFQDDLNSEHSQHSRSSIDMIPSP